MRLYAEGVWLYDGGVQLYDRGAQLYDKGAVLNGEGYMKGCLSNGLKKPSGQRTYFARTYRFNLLLNMLSSINKHKSKVAKNSPTPL